MEKKQTMTCIVFEGLEGRVLMSVTPSAREEYMLELINRARSDPQHELGRLLAANDPDVKAAMSFFNVNQSVLETQFASLVAAPPLAWNSQLATSAFNHSQAMLAADDQQHQLPGEPDLATRVTNAGYGNYTIIGENIYAFGKSILHTHAGFVIDWGDTATGIQTPAGHRENILSPEFREVGISIIDGQPNHATGPLLTTEDFGNRAFFGNPIVVGAAYSDLVKHNSFYDVGEGLSGMTITAVRTSDSATFTTTTNAAGDYQMALPSGTYTISATGAGFDNPIVRSGIAVGSDNVWVDFQPPTLPDLRGQFKGKAPGQIKPGVVQNGTFQITNAGTLAVNGPVTTNFYFSTDPILDSGDIQVGTKTTNLTLAPLATKGFNFQITGPMTLPEGQYYLLADIDPAGLITELSTSNNSATALSTTRVYPPITNLIPTVSMPAKKVHVGDVVNYTLRIRNNGNVTASGTVSATVQLRSKTDPNTLIDVTTVPDFAVSIKKQTGQAFKFSFTVPSLAADKYQLVVTIASNLSTQESNTADNVAASEGRINFVV